MFGTEQISHGIKMDIRVLRREMSNGYVQSVDGEIASVTRERVKMLEELGIIKYTDRGLYVLGKRANEFEAIASEQGTYVP
jgi:hypothetical protein